MENDNTVFQNPTSQNDPAAQAQRIPPADFLTPVQNPMQNDLPKQAQPPQDFLQKNPPPTPKPESGGKSKIKRILGILASVLIILGLVVIVATFFTPGMNKNSSVGKVTLTYWGVVEDNSVMQSVISDFEKQHPDIIVNYQKQDVNQYKDRLVTRIPNGNGPDIFSFHNTWYSTLKTYLLALPSEVISPEEFSGVYYPVVQKDLSKNGAIYGIPLSIDTLALFINTQLFQAAGISAPSNWNDFVNDARAITVIDKNGKITTAGAAMGTYDNITHAADIVSLLFLENGVDLNNLQASSDRIDGALVFYTAFTQGDNKIWDNSLDPSQLAFAKGNLGMFFGYPSDYFAIKQFNPNLIFQIVPVPQLPDQNVTMASYWVQGVSVKSIHQKEAFLFMKFLAQKETEQKLYSQEAKSKDFGEPYARNDLADSLKTNPLVYPFVLQAQTAASSPFVGQTFDNGLNQQLNTSLQTVINAYLSGNGSNKNDLDTFIQDSTKIMQQYQY